MKMLALLTTILIMNCQSQNAQSPTNALIHESSPYLLQHAHNPVNWYGWHPKTLAKAQAENKLIIISIGYAACHWCHVMARESFQDSLVAQAMNKSFVNIKVDREERPDIDKIYMNAVQLITGQGGWPLNIVALPDGRPVWGGTYFEKKDWIQAISKLAKYYKDQPEKLEAYADKLEQGIKELDLIERNPNTPIFEKATLKNTLKQWQKDFDLLHGGLRKAPKFMMPNNYQFLLRYAYQTNDTTLLDYVNLSLTKMAYGGIFDPIGGGFSRYAVDEQWHIPHFEKMLYDNAQLVSLYADAYLLTKNKLYKNVITQTLQFIQQEMTHASGAFYSSLGADSPNSQGVPTEGAFYTWTKAGLKSLLGTDYPLFADYYNIRSGKALWEDDKYVLIRTQSDTDFIKTHGLSETILNRKKAHWKTRLAKARSQRPKPALDNKTLTSWNALMICGYLDAYRVLKTPAYLEAALKNATFLWDHQRRKSGELNHSYKAGQSRVNGYLEDYAAVIKAFLSLYENTLDATWLNRSKALAEVAFTHFFDPSSQMFFFTSNQDHDLVSRSIAYRDQVIPSSNSMMAKNLFRLGHYFEEARYEKTARNMLNNVLPEMPLYPTSYSNWCDLLLNFMNPFYEIAIVGKDAKKKIDTLSHYYIPNKLIAGSTYESAMPLLQNRFLEGETYIYVCVDRYCKTPVSQVDEAIPLIEK